MGLVAYLLWRRRDSLGPGILFAGYLVLAGLERFTVEFVRRNSDVVAGLTAAQLESLLMVAIGFAWIWAVVGRRGLRSPKATSQVPAFSSASGSHVKLSR